MNANVELQMTFDETYRPVLSIPINDCQRFSTRPLSWLRYVASTIYGGEGDISACPEGSPVVDYSRADIESGVYYYVTGNDSEGLLDPDLMDDTSESESSSTSSTSMTGISANRCRDFAQRVEDRDRTCSVTNVSNTVYGGSCRACYIIPHSKGHQYLINLVKHRKADVDLPLESIDDTRNGILLHRGFCSPFMESSVAFLRTPNFAMGINDVPFVAAPPLLGFGEPQPGEPRLTFQHFNLTELDSLVAFGAPHNSDVRHSIVNANPSSGGAGGDLEPESEWPPDVIFDAVYGCAALKMWGVPDFIDLARRRVEG